MKAVEYIIPINETANDYDEMFIGVIRRQPVLIRCKDCEWFIRDIQKADGTDDKRFKRRWCEIHRVETHDYGYCHWAYRRKDEGIHSDNREGS